MLNSQMLTIDVKKNKKVKIANINFEGVTQIDEDKLAKNERYQGESIFRLFSTSKYIEENYEADKPKSCAVYAKGYRDAELLLIPWCTTTIKMLTSTLKSMKVPNTISGIFRWIGNTKYAARDLTES